MNFRVSLAVAAGVLGSDPSLALAEPTPQEACAYFSSFVPIAAPNLTPDVVYNPEAVGEVIAGKIDLERYQSFRFEILRKFGIIRADGNFGQNGSVSAEMTCLVDIKDRRVITINVSAGPLTGKDRGTDHGEARKVLGALTSATQIGLQANQGKY